MSERRIPEHLVRLRKEYLASFPKEGRIQVEEVDFDAIYDARRTARHIVNMNEEGVFVVPREDGVTTGATTCSIVLLDGFKDGSVWLGHLPAGWGFLGEKREAMDIAQRAANGSLHAIMLASSPIFAGDEKTQKAKRLQQCWEMIRQMSASGVSLDFTYYWNDVLASGMGARVLPKGDNMLLQVSHEII